MANVDNFIFYGQWHDNLALIKDEQKRNEFVWKIVHYARTGEIEYSENEFENAYIRTICETIDKNKNNYAMKIENGKNVGRKQEFDRERLKELIAEGRSGKDIARELGVSTDAIYHDDVWKFRKNFNNYK